MDRTDINDLDAVVKELGIDDAFVTPAEAVRELKAELEKSNALISSLEQERDRMRKALEPFKEAAFMFNEEFADNEWVGGDTRDRIIRVGHLRAAARALEDK